MSFVTTSTVFSPILGLLLAVIVLTVIVAVIASATRGGKGAGGAAYFAFGLSLVALGIGVATAGVVTHSVSELVGPTPQSFVSPGFSPGLTTYCSSSLSPTPPNPPPVTPGPLTTTIAPANPPNGMNDTTCPYSAGGNGGFYSGSSAPLVADFSDGTNHYTSISVLAGLFLITTAVGYLLAWRRARRMVNEVGLGQPPLGTLPVTYGYLVAGLTALSLLVFVPLAADNVFRAIAPGVNETSGHAGGVRNLVTFGVLGGLSAGILRYHLRYLARLRATDSPAGEDDNREDSPPAL